VDGKFWEFLGYHSSFDWSNPLSIVIVNQDSWNELSAEHQKAVEKLARELEPEFWTISKGLNDDNLKMLEEKGMTVSAPGPELKEEILAAGKRVWSEYLKTAGPEANAIVKAFLEKVGR
jgi:TRAP-type C4-dicarboxylate transport system substrate-binding protein